MSKIFVLEMPGVTNHADETAEQTKVGERVDLPFHAFLLVKKPPGRAKLDLAGDGAVDVFEQKGADQYGLLAKVPGSFRAKTGIFVPELNRYYLAVPHHEKQDAEVRVYEIQ